jgi:uncharacterized protein
MKPTAESVATRMKKVAFTIAGTIFLVLGAIGIVVPFLPTTPFLLLSAGCYIKGSERMHRWLINNKLFGVYIKNYREGKGISARGKIFSLMFLWVTILYAVFFVTNVLVYQIIMFIIPSAVTIYIVRVPTYRKNKGQLEEEPCQ